MRPWALALSIAGHCILLTVTLLESRGPERAAPPGATVAVWFKASADVVFEEAPRPDPPAPVPIVESRIEELEPLARELQRDDAADVSTPLSRPLADDPLSGEPPVPVTRLRPVPAATPQRHEPVQTTTPAAPKVQHDYQAPSPVDPLRVDYPRSAQRRGLEGTVVIEVMVGPTGAIESGRVLESSGRDLLDDAALRAVTSCPFRPARLDGLPVRGVVEIPVRFELARRR